MFFDTVQIIFYPSLNFVVVLLDTRTPENLKKKRNILAKANS